MSTVIELINACETREDDEDFKNAVDLLFEDLEKKDSQHFAVRQYKKFKLAAGKTAKSVLVSCGARLAPFDIRELRELMAYDELQLDMLGDRKTAMFVIISDTDDTFNFIVAMMYSQLFNLLCDKADDDEHHGRLNYNFPAHLINRMCSIGRLHVIDCFISICMICGERFPIIIHRLMEGNLDLVLIRNIDPGEIIFNIKIRPLLNLIIMSHDHFICIQQIFDRFIGRRCTAVRLCSIGDHR